MGLELDGQNTYGKEEAVWLFAHSLQEEASQLSAFFATIYFTFSQLQM